MPNIYFIHRFPLNRDTFIKDEFPYFSEKGYNIKYLDISSILKKIPESEVPSDLIPFVIRFANKKSFIDFILKHDKNTLIISEIGLLSNSAWVYLSIFRAKLPHIVFDGSSLHSEKRNIGDINKHIKRLSIKKILNKPGQLLQLVLAKIFFVPAEMVITNKNKLPTEKKVLCDKHTEIRYSMSLDYKISKQIDSIQPTNKEYAVFIDQYFVHHPDFKTKHITHNFSASEYYTELNQYLKRFSEKYDLQIIIASHPRRDELQKKDFLPQFDIHYNQTNSLIMGAKVVLLHFSTAINFAVIFNKPIVFLSSNLFKDSNIEPKILALASYFSQLPLNMSTTELRDENILNVDKEKYTSYFNHYIAHPKAVDETFAEQIEMVLKRNGLYID